MIVQRSRKDIYTYLDSWRVKNWSMDDDNTINVDSGVTVGQFRGTYIPVKFGEV